MAATFDDGILHLFRIDNIANPGDQFKEGLFYKSSFYFAFEKVGITRVYTAKQAGERVDDVIHIYQDRTIQATDICVMEDEEQYKILQAQHTTDDDGIRITVLTLERLDQKYAIKTEPS